MAGRVVTKLKNRVHLALNICTYKREDQLKHNISQLLQSKFFDDLEEEYYGKLDIFIVDNASEINMEYNPFVHLFHNPNTGGSGGFQRGIEEIRKYDNEFTHVIFMDDDVSFENSCFYILFDFLRTEEEIYKKRPVAGRMIDKDNPTIQWTAAEKWNGGDIQHVEFLRDISDGTYQPGKVNYDIDADYGGWWFCCYPYSFVKDNDVMPFFIHCDDVEYGLRCGEVPIIIEGVQVWHETWEKKMSPEMVYYDVRNSLFVNKMYGINQDYNQIISEWKNKIGYYHARYKYNYEYMGIKGMADYLKGNEWLSRVDSMEYHSNLQKKKGIKLLNALIWRILTMKIKVRR